MSDELLYNLTKKTALLLFKEFIENIEDSEEDSAEWNNIYNDFKIFLSIKKISPVNEKKKKIIKEISSENRCPAITKNGSSQCKKAFVKNSKYCSVHKNYGQSTISTETVESADETNEKSIDKDFIKNDDDKTNDIDFIENDDDTNDNDDTNDIKDVAVKNKKHSDKIRKLKKEIM